MALRRCIYCFETLTERPVFPDLESVLAEFEAHPECAELQERQPLAADVLQARRAVAARMEKSRGSGQEVLLAAILGELIEQRVAFSRTL